MVLVSGVRSEAASGCVDQVARQEAVSLERMVSFNVARSGVAERRWMVPFSEELAALVSFGNRVCATPQRLHLGHVFSAHLTKGQFSR
jgi:hypothetical protein